MSRKTTLGLVVLAVIVGALLAAGRFDMALPPLTNSVPEGAKFPGFHVGMLTKYSATQFDGGVGYLESMYVYGNVLLSTATESVTLPFEGVGLLVVHASGAYTVTGDILALPQAQRADTYVFEDLHDKAYELFEQDPAPTETHRVHSDGTLESITIDGR